MTDYLRRELAPLVQRALASLPVVVVTGLRQVGKTTFLQQEPALQGRRYLTLDDLNVLEAARLDPESLLGGEEPITIDEAQRCPELLLAIKRSVDRFLQPPGKDQDIPQIRKALSKVGIEGDGPFAFGKSRLNLLPP